MAKACISTMGDKIIGYNLPNGEESLLFNELLKITGNGDIALNLYKQTRTEAFQLRKYHYELDKNEEPVIKNRYYGSTTHVEDYFIDPKAPIKFQHKTVNDIKPGVEELFESNPELANAIYEALGFKQNNKITDFSDTEVKEEVYHSSTAEFSEFKQGKDGAIHFGDKKAATERTNKSSKKYLKKVKLKVNNLIESVDSVDFEGTRKDKESINYIVDKLKIAKTETQEHLIALFANEKITKEQLEQYWNSDLETIYKEIFNADGYYYINLAENKGSKSYVVFNPNQIEILEDGEISYNEKNKEYEYVNNSNQITPQQKQQAQQQYSQYLDTIFPDSQVKDIVYHGTDRTFEQFSKNAEKATISDQGIFFAPTKNQARNSGKIIIKAVINSNPLISDDRIERISEKKKQELLAQGYTGYVYSYNKTISSADDIVVFEPEQIHILGNKQDIEGFKEFVLTNKPKPKSLKEIAEFYNIQNTSFFNKDVDSAKLRAEVNKLGYELVENPNNTFYIAKNGKMVKFYSTTKTPKKYIEQMEMVEVNPETSWENKKSLLTQIFPDMTKEEWNDYPELIRQQMLNCI